MKLLLALEDDHQRSVLAGTLAELGIEVTTVPPGPEEQQEALARFRAVLDHTGEAIFISRSDTGQCVDVNETACRWLGYTREELLDVGPRGVEVGHPISSPAEWARHVAGIRAAGEPVLFEQAALKRKDGTVIPAEVSVSLHAIDAQEYVVGVVRDITRRRRAEAELRLTQFSVEQAAESMFRLGADGRILAVNRMACERLGYRRDELLRMTVFDINPDHTPESWREHWAWLARVGNAGFEMRHRKRNGDFMPVEISAAILDVGEEQQCCAFVRDISERKQLEMQLLLADKMTSLGTLAAGVAHELNNPMTYVQGNLEFLAEWVRDSVDGKRADELQLAIEEAREGARRVVEIVHQLVTFARADEPDSARGASTVDEAIDIAVRMTKNQLRHRTRLVLDRVALPPIPGHAGRLAQVLVNLIVNALQALPEEEPDDNEIRIRTRLGDDDQVVIAVSDNGPGIPRDLRGRIFEPFFTTKAVGVGTGLGLSVCHGIVTRLGGSIEVGASLVGGAAFRIKLPTVDEPESRATPPSTASVGCLPRGRVLIIDDEPLVLRSLTRVLGGDHEVAGALSGREGLECLSGETDFDVVLCDLMMPSMNGMEVYRAAQRLNGNLAERFLFLSGGAFTGSLTQFASEMGKRLITKPLDFDRLRRRLWREIGARRARPGSAST